MFKIAISTTEPTPQYSFDDLYRMISEAGFDGVDVNAAHFYPGRDIRNAIPAPMYTVSDKEFVKNFFPMRDAAKKYGIDNYQAHSPFPSYIADNDEQNDFMIEVLRKTIIGCDAMNCRNLIVHPFFLGYSRQLSPEDEWNINIDRYSRLIPTARQYGVTICLENMFDVFRGRVYASCCSQIDTACRYVDTLNEIAGEKLFGFCLDTGHLILVGLDAKNAMETLGDRIVAFHVHDNNGITDQHIGPYLGVQDWDRLIEGLKSIRYDKTLSFETGAWRRNLPQELMLPMLRFIAEAGRMMSRRASE